MLVIVSGISGNRLIERPLSAMIEQLDPSRFTGGTYLVQVMDITTGEVKAFKVLRLQ